MTRKRHSEAEDSHEAEFSVLPRETWEFVKGQLEVFEEALQKANELSKAPRDDASRLAALKSLEAVVNLIQALYPENRLELLGPIFRTHEALLGVQKGAALNPLLVGRHTGRPDRAPEYERFQGEAAAAMQLLMNAGHSKDESASKVARYVERFDLRSLAPKSRTGITANTIKGWRDEFGSADGSIGAMRFQIVLGLEEVTSRDSQPAATWVLKSLLGSALPENRKKPHI